MASLRTMPSSSVDPMGLLSDDLILMICEHAASASDLARCRAVCHAFRRQAEADKLWQKWCEREGLNRNGSSRPTSRTYCSWMQTYRDGRCLECGNTYVAKINLDGGSSQATMWHGAKVPLCGNCACAAVHCFRSHAPNITQRTLPRLLRRFMPEGLMVAHICGRNVEGMLKELGLEKALIKWLAEDKKRASEESQLGDRARYVNVRVTPCPTFLSRLAMPSYPWAETWTPRVCE